MNVTTVNHLVGIVGILSIIGIVLFLISLALLPHTNNPLRKLASNWGFPLAFVIALGASLTSFYYSDIVHYTPCTLCWYQRIFMIPQVFILAVALWKKEVVVRKYSLVLVKIGALISIYHIFVEHNLVAAPCGANGPSCTTRYVYEYGFVSIPVLALIAFILIGIGVYFYKRG